MERVALIYEGLAQRRTGLPARTGRQNGEDFKGKGDDNGMAEKSFMTVEEVAAELRVSKSKAYQIVRELNAELRAGTERRITETGLSDGGGTCERYIFSQKSLLQRLSGKEMI